MTRNLDAAIDLIKRFEGLHKIVAINGRRMVARYFDPVGIPTIGYGHVCKADQPPLTMSEAEDLLYADVRSVIPSIRKSVESELTDNQLNALVSFVFNVGSGNFRASTLRSKLNNEDYYGAADEFPKWKFAGGRMLPGLLRRRLEEKTLFLS